MNLSRINLNLLVVLDVLLQEKHVTRASERLHVTQSTVSTALNQLRELFQDELLIREKNKMVLTRRGEELATKTRLALKQLDNLVFNEIDFDPKTAEKTFRLAMDDFLECLLLAELNHYLSTEAPKIKCEIEHSNHISADLFSEPRAIDLGLGLVHNKSHFLRYENLYTDHFVCVGRYKHPLLEQPLTLKDYLAAEQLSLYSPSQQQHDLADQALRELGKQRNISLNVTHVSTALYLLMSSNLIATVPFNLVKKAQPILNLSYQELPFQVPEVPVYQVWHAQYDNDAAYRWLREVIKNILQDRLKQFQYPSLI